MRTDIDEVRDWVIQQLEAGVSQRTISTTLKCKPDTLKRRLRAWGVDHLHNRPGRGRPRPWSWRHSTQYLKEDFATNIHRLKLKLWRDGMKPMECEECGWNRRAADGRLPLELHHVNGDELDNRLDNLIILCPNCHSLKDTHRGLNKGKKKRILKQGLSTLE
jgi:hypothetical protein